MTKRYFLFLFFVAVAAVSVMFSACGEGKKLEGETIYEPKFASHFRIYSYGRHSSVLEVRNPWQGAEEVSSQLFISRNGELPTDDFKGDVVKAPLRRVVCMSSSYVAFIDELGETESVKGVSGALFMTNERIREGYAQGIIGDVGFDGNMNYELLASLKPDLVMIFGVASENTAITGKLRELKIPVVYIADYLENTPLGKAEWLVAFGELYDKRADTEERFDDIADAYLNTQALVRKSVEEAERPKVMLNAPYNDVWFVPGDRSYMVELIRDAGGEYVFAGSDNDVSRPISIETAYVAAKDADIWINPNQIRTIKELVSVVPAFADIDVVRNHKVYNSTKRDTPEGGSDFWESGVLRADIVLKDLVKILHPQLESTHELYYFEELR